MLRFLLVGLLLCACAKQKVEHDKDKPPENSEFPLAASLTKYIESKGRHLGEVGKFSGYVLVAKDKKPVYAKGFGLADRETKRPPDHHTSFRIGSVTKHITAVAILHLQEQGKLSVSDTVGKWLPGYPAVGRDITIHQLLTHTAGLANYTSFPEFWDKRSDAISLDELIALFSSKPLEFKPGEKFSYSNSGYALLSRIIEQASGKSYKQYVEQELFRPLGLTRLVVGDFTGGKNRAKAYTVSQGKVVPAHPINMASVPGDGGVRASAHELTAWLEALWAGKVINLASLSTMLTPEKQRYGYGFVITEFMGRELVGHDGGIDGFLTTLLIFPKQDVMIVAWSNNERVDVKDIGVAAAKALWGVEPGLAPESKPVKVSVEDIKGYRGTFSLTDEAKESMKKNGATQSIIDSVATLDITMDGETLRAKPVGQGEFPLTATNKREFTFDAAGVTIVFAEDGKSLQLKQGGLDLKFTKD